MSQEEKEQHELDKIRMKKMKALMESQKRQQATQDFMTNVDQKVDYILKVVLMPDAYSHLNNLKVNEPPVYQRIFNELVGPEVVANVDYLLAAITKQGVVERRIPLDAIIYLERQAKGIKGKIKVKRKDETMDLGSYLSSSE